MTTTDTTVNNLIINTMTQAQYSQITPSANELYLVTDSTITSSEVTTALGYTPTSPANVDGQWVASTQSLTVSTSVTTSPQEFNLKTLNYLPNDNNKYEVLVWLDVTAGSSSSSAVYLSSDIVSGNCVSVQTNVSKYGNMNFAIPVNSTLKVQVTLAAVNRVNFTALGYRRIGTNS